MGDLERFLDFLYEKNAGWVYTPLKLKSGEWKQEFFQWPSQRQELIDWITLSKNDGNVYVAPALFSRKSATKEAVVHANVAWLEFDGQKTIQFKDVPEPDAIIQTSSDTHLHCYWKIPKTESAALEEINRRLTYYLGADYSGWDSTQVLRPPETINWKYNVPVKLKKLVVPIFKHNLSIFDSAPTVTKPPLEVTYDDLELPEAILARHSLGKELTEMVLRENAVEPNRSTFLMRSGYLLATANLSELEIIALLYHIDGRIKKFVGRADQLMRLSEIAALAVLDSNKFLNIEGYSPLEILNNNEVLEWIRKGWLHKNGIMLVSGAPGVGKTQWCFDIGYRFATGQSILGEEAVPPMSVAFLSLEMEIVELKYILEHQMREWPKETIPLYDANFKAFAPDEERTFAAYERILATHKPKVFIIDSLSELASDDLKESEARVIMGWVRKMRKEYDCAIILIHHNRKASDGNKRPRKLSDLYGSYIFGKLSETVLSLWDLEKNNELDVDSFKVRFGSKAPVRIKRSENLTFSKVEVTINVSGRSREVGAANPLLAIFKESGGD